MSLLRDGFHRRAPLTARCGVARSGAARMGCVYGQDDLSELTREIKDEDLTGEGPFYVWRETLPIDSPFANLNQFLMDEAAAPLVMGLEADIEYITTANLILNVFGTIDYNPIILANLFLAIPEEDGDITFVTILQEGGEIYKSDPNPLSPAFRLRPMRY